MLLVLHHRLDVTLFYFLHEAVEPTFVEVGLGRLVNDERCSAHLRLVCGQEQVVELLDRVRVDDGHYRIWRPCRVFKIKRLEPFLDGIKLDVVIAEMRSVAIADLLLKLLLELVKSDSIVG